MHVFWSIQVSCQVIKLDLRLTARWALILLVGAVRCIASFTEQPGGSLMRHYPYIFHLRRMIREVLGGTWDSTFLSRTQANLLAMWHLLGKKRSNFQIQKTDDDDNFFLNWVTWGPLDTKLWNPVEDWGLRRDLNVFNLFRGLPVYWPFCVAQAVGEVFAEANFKGQKGETSEVWCWHGEKVPECKRGMEAVLGLDTLGIVQTLQSFKSKAKLNLFFYMGLPFELRVGTPFLKQSAAYTPKFARTVCKLHLKYMEPCFFLHGQMGRRGNNSIQLTAFNFDSSPCSVYNGRRHIRDIYAVRCMGNLWKTYTRPVWASVLKNQSMWAQRCISKQTSFKQHGLVFWLSTWEAKQPYKWKHANLQEIRKFLLSEVEAGRYCPVLDLWSSHAMPSEMYHRIH